jgi:hypothetical protein
MDAAPRFVSPPPSPGIAMPEVGTVIQGEVGHGADDAPRTKIGLPPNGPRSAIDGDLRDYPIRRPGSLSSANCLFLVHAEDLPSNNE